VTNVILQQKDLSKRKFSDDVILHGKYLFHSFWYLSLAGWRRLAEQNWRHHFSKVYLPSKCGDKIGCIIREKTDKSADRQIVWILAVLFNQPTAVASRLTTR